MSTILIAESDPMFGAVLQDRLHVAGHTAELLLDREQATTSAASSQADLLILDVTEAGLDVVTTLRGGDSTRAMPIMVLSESAESGDRVAALRAGADDYVTKPCDLEELLLRAERLVGSRVAKAPVLQGDLSNYPLWELMQYINQAGKSGELILRGRAGTGRLKLRNGIVLAASWEKFSGNEALLATLGMKQGSFRFISGAVHDPPEGEAPLQIHQILMQAAWLEDELEKRRQFLPPTGVPLKETGKQLPENTEADEINLANLPVKEVLDRLRSNPEGRVFDLINGLPRAPQAIRLAVACLVEREILAVPDGELGEYPNTAEIASSMLIDLTIGEFLTNARAAGFGTSALPFLILVEPGIWPELIKLFEVVPGYQRNQKLRGFVDQLKTRNGGSVSFSSEAGKLSLNALMLTKETQTKVEAILTVCAGVLMWLDEAADPEAISRVLQRLDAVRTPSVGIVVASKSAGPTAAKLIKRAKRWRITPHSPQSLLGVLRLLQPPQKS